MAEAKTNEVTISKSTPLPKDKVYFPGKAVVSDKEAEALKSAADTQEQAEEAAPTKKKK